MKHKIKGHMKGLIHRAKRKMWLENRWMLSTNMLLRKIEWLNNFMIDVYGPVQRMRSPKKAMSICRMQSHVSNKHSKSMYSIKIKSSGRSNHSHDNISRSRLWFDYNRFFLTLAFNTNGVVVAAHFMYCRFREVFPRHEIELLHTHTKNKCNLIN